ncbi:unnamed protein product [Microthlaspi erraticum]|uniref:DUF1985 domain-containing protein n=1 Tax=Microthlaspi erraticum TaxID=1685480 RepID=A0A6D2J3G9_9BRAS|nr:unnamed protein product [Microthlaspi erraticum]
MEGETILFEILLIVRNCCTFVKHTLRNDPEAFARIKNSRFGKLWDFPAIRCPVSCKLIHALVSRQVLSKKHYEMWTVFGGQPMRFSLSEFASVTGLHCGEFPEGYDPDWQPPASKDPDKWWREIIGNDSRTTLGDIATRLRKEEIQDVERKLRLCLILLVDGVLVVNSQTHRPTPKYVTMLEDIEAFLNFPWGRESFMKTISTMRPLRNPAVKDEDPVRTLVKNLGQTSFRLLGFPLALQLLAFQSIPVLVEYLPTSTPYDTLLDLPDELFPTNPSLSNEDVLNAENHPNLSVNPLIPIDAPEGFVGWGEFAEKEVQDRKIAYLEGLIANQHRFTKAEWPGGATDYEPIVHVHKPPRIAHVKHIFNRKKDKRPLGVRSSPRTSRKSSRGKEKVAECSHSASPEDLVEQNKWLLDEVRFLKEEHCKLVARTTRLERKVQFQASRPLRKLATQRRVHRSKRKTPKSSERDVSGSEDFAADSIISQVCNVDGWIGP